MRPRLPYFVAVNQLDHRIVHPARIEARDIFPVLSQIPRNLTINGSTVEPSVFYTCEDANGTAQTWAEDSGAAAGLLSHAGAGDVPVYGSTNILLGDRRFAVRYDGGAYHAAAANVFGDITTEDFVVLLLAKYDNSVASAGYGGKRIGSGAFNGWGVRKGTGDTFSCVLDVGASAITNLDSGAMTNGTWHVGMCFCDRSGSGQWYLDGAESGTARDISSLSASITSDTPFTIGAIGGSGSSKHTVALFAMWKKAGWLDSHLQPAVASAFYKAFTLGPWLA